MSYRNGLLYIRFVEFVLVSPKRSRQAPYAIMPSRLI